MTTKLWPKPYVDPAEFMTNFGYEDFYYGPIDPNQDRMDQDMRHIIPFWPRNSLTGININTESTRNFNEDFDILLHNNILRMTIYGGLDNDPAKSWICYTTQEVLMYGDLTWNPIFRKCYPFNLDDRINTRIEKLQRAHHKNSDSPITPAYFATYMLGILKDFELVHTDLYRQLMQYLKYSRLSKKETNHETTIL
ncbi:hypothetical protein [Weissella viridescens]|uniref:hypothetical protein n=1 Tax=Weissella viridescens TaxID=1629 RepID=UPI003AF3032D